MSRSGIKPVVRVVTVALFWAALSLLAERPAVANGCHAPERPVLGRTFAWEVEPPITLVLESGLNRPPAFVPIPCTGDPSGTTAREIPVAPASLSHCEPRPIAPRTIPPVGREPTTSSRLADARLDRPPRR